MKYLENKTEEYNFEKNVYNPNHKERNLATYRALYKEGIHPRDKLKVFFKTNFALLKFIVESPFYKFKVKDRLNNIHKKVQEEFSRDGIDEILYDQGDYIYPSDRLSNIINRISSIEESDSILYCYEFIADYHKKYFTYLAAFENHRLKDKSQ